MWGLNQQEGVEYVEFFPLDTYFFLCLFVDLYGIVYQDLNLLASTYIPGRPRWYEGGLF